MEVDNLAAICRARQGDEESGAVKDHSSVNTRFSRSNSLVWGLVFEAGLGIVALGAAWLLEVDLWTQIAGEKVHVMAAIGWGCLATLPMLVAFALLIRSAWPPLRRLRRQVRQLVKQLIQGASVVDIAALAIIAGVGEELLFRGVIQTLAIRWSNSAIGLVAASLLFGMAHSISRTYFVLATLVGFYLGWLALHFGELITPITVHALYDFCVLWWVSRGWRQARP